MLNSMALNKSINNIRERALTLTYKDNQSSFKELLEKYHYLTVPHKNLQVLVKEIFKVKSDLVPNIMKDVFELKEPPYNLRSESAHFTGRNLLLISLIIITLRLITVSYQLSTYSQLHNILR